jgi:hypothetical protein
MSIFGRRVQAALIVYVAFVFVQSLFFKFTDSPETQHIFGTLDNWAGTLGFAGLFAPGGLFNAKVIGTAELVASALLLFSLVKGPGLIRALGALLGLGVISGAILFHLFTPLGVAVINSDGTSDGGLLFAMACGVWIACALLLFANRQPLLALLGRRT